MDLVQTIGLETKAYHFGQIEFYPSLWVKGKIPHIPVKIIFRGDVNAAERKADKRRYNMTDPEILDCSQEDMVNADWKDMI